MSWRAARLYLVAGDEITVEIKLSSGRKQVARFTVEGEKTDLEALADRIVADVARRLG